MAYGDHIAITSGNKSTTRREVSVAGCPLAPLIGVTHRDSSDTYRRIGLDSEILPARVSHRDGEPDLDLSNLLGTVSNLSCQNRDINRYLTFYTGILWLKPLAHEALPVANALREYVVTADRRSHQGRKPGTVIPVRKLERRRVPKAGSTAICVCHSQRHNIVGPYGSGRSRGSSQWGAAEPRPSR
jgi:hypothetical protein